MTKKEVKEEVVEEAPVEDAPVEEVKVEDAPVEEVPAEAPVEEAPVEEDPKKEEPTPVKAKGYTPPSSVPVYTKAEFKELIAKYKEQNPTKYEMKKEVLQAKLNSLK